MSDTLLIGLAMLRANWDRDQKTFIDNFVPFVTDCLRDAGSDGSMTAGEIQRCVKGRFGIELPQGALKTVLGRAVRLKLAERAHHRFRPTAKTLEQVPLDRRRGDVAREIERLIAKFVEYLRDHHGDEWSRKKAEASLRAYVEEWSIPLLRQSLSGGVTRQDAPTQREADYLVSSFIVHLRNEDPDGFRYLESLVKASMLTAGLYLDQSSVGQPFTELTVYLDSPFLLSLLGVNGQEESAAAAELVSLAGELGAAVGCFPETVCEVRGVLQATARDLRSRRRRGGKVRLHPRVATSGMSASELEELADQTEQSLQRLGVSLRARPRTTAAGSTDMRALSATLQETVGYANESTRDHDATCLAAVHQIRSGQLQLRLEHARAIFVTTNDRVVAAAAAHFGNARDPLVAPVAMMDHAFATILWLKRPTAAPDLPWKHLLADCHAALNPDDLLWNRYLDEIDALAQRENLDDETYFLMRHGQEARAVLMERTRGRNDRLDQRSVQRIVDDAKSAIRAPADARAAEAEKRAREAEERARALHEAEKAERRNAEREQAEREAREEERVRLAAERAREVSWKRIARVQASRYARRATTATRWLLVGGAGIAVWATFDGRGWPAWLPVMLSVAASLASLFGTSVTDVLGRLTPWVEQRIRPRIEKRLADVVQDAAQPMEGAARHPHTAAAAAEEEAA